MDIYEYLKLSEEVLAASRQHPGIARIDEAIDVVIDALSTQHALLVCGNGGSAADAMHITGELVGRFLRDRRALNCICLSADPTILTAWANDVSFNSVFARQVEAYGQPGAVLLGISTSGNSINVIGAFEVARAMGMTTIALTGAGGGKLADLAEILIDVPSSSTPLVQQVHICLYHYLCEQVEARLD